MQGQIKKTIEQNSKKQYGKNSYEQKQLNNILKARCQQK
jgi:hypothetical protein